MAAGSRGVGIGGSADRSVIVTGDHARISIGDPERVRDRPDLDLTHALPAGVGDFQGRGREIDALLEALGADGGQAAVTAIGGMGGVGKTALAVHVAHKLVEAGRAPDGQLLVELAGTSDRPLSPIGALAKVIQSFEPAARVPDDEGDAARLYRAVLDGRHALIVLDNARDAAQVRPLLEWRPPRCLVIVTSRQTIAFAGLRSVPLDVLDEGEARALLRSMVGPNRAADEELDMIAARCGRLPLALRAAGTFLALHPDWKPAEYAAALSDERGRLQRLRVEGDAKLDVASVLVLSLRRLADEDTTLAGRWTMLGVFPTSFDRAAAAAVWDVPPDTARDGLSALVRRSLVLYDPESERHRLHDLMRDVAVGTAGESVVGAGHGERLREATARHAAHYRAVLAGANALFLRGRETAAAGLTLYDLEQRNIHAGYVWACTNAASQPRDGAVGPFRRLRNWLRSTPPPDDSVLRLAASYPDAGVHVLVLRLHLREFIDWFVAAAEAYRRLGDREGEGRALGNLGVAYKNQGELRRAIELYEQVLAIARETGDRWAEGATLGNLGGAYNDLGEPRRAIDLCEQHLRIAREIGDRRGEGAALGNLGHVYKDLGEPRRAIELYEQVLAITREIGDHQLEGSTLGNLGNAYDDLGEPRRAIDLYDQALAIAREIGDRRGEAQLFFNSGLVLDALGDRARAIARLRTALEIEEQIEDPTAGQTRAKLAEWEADGA